MKLIVEKDNRSIIFDIDHQRQSLLISVYDKEGDNEKVLCFQGHFTLQMMRKEHNSQICQNWKILCSCLQQITTNFPQKINISQQGKVIVNYSIKIMGNEIDKQISFKLDKKLKPDQQLSILRHKVQRYEQELTNMKKQMTKLKIQNYQFNNRLNLLQSIVSQKTNLKNNDKSEQNIQKKQDILKESKIQQKNVVKKQQKVIKEEHIKLIQDIDPNCLHYNKFKIKNNKIQSLYEDYYQIYWKNSLPEKGSVNVSIKMTAKNHCSIGILAQSELKNQYSFQNKKSMCLYTYYQGFFRGLYLKGEYIPLNWGMQLNEILHYQINMTKGVMLISSNTQQQGRQIDIKQLLKQKVYFFIEMYQKDNSIEIL